MTFPIHRMRRLRSHPWSREMVRETRLHPAELIQPFFVGEGKGAVNGGGKGHGRRDPVSSMPGVEQLSIDTLVEDCKAVEELGLGAVLLFGLPAKKDSTGSGGYADDGIVPRALRALKEACPRLFLIADVCLCEYTDHGHCGILEERPLGSGHGKGHGKVGAKGGERSPQAREASVQNDPTLALLGKEAVAYARAGADMVAPSAMMDGQVAAIRQALDASGFEGTPILSYAAKFASGFYGPFREAADSAPQFGDRRTYQMDPANAREALRETALDIEEGADMVMVKPALSYLDVIRSVADMSPVPVAAYNVSGEYSMVKAAAEKGWIDGDRVALEILTSIRRAGADVIISYHAREIAGRL